jgi:peptidoglycan hydrolase CwlO-like protein
VGRNSNLTTQTQHKPSREDKNSKELSDYKREVGQLKRQVSRLQKQLEKAMSKVVEGDVVADSVDETGVVPTVETKSNQNQCEECGQDGLKMTQIPTGTLVTCPNCPFRKVVK